jgi:hypothetical protein
VFNSRGASFIYAKFVMIHLALFFAVFGYTMFSTFRPISPKSVSDCIGGDSQYDDMVLEFCRHGWSVVKGVSVAAYSLGLLVQICKESLLKKVLQC